MEEKTYKLTLIGSFIAKYINMDWNGLLDCIPLIWNQGYQLWIWKPRSKPCINLIELATLKLKPAKKSRSRSHLPDCPHLNPKIPGVVAISYPRCCPKTWPPSGRRWDISLPKINKKEGSHHLCSSKNWDYCPAPISWAFITKPASKKAYLSCPAAARVPFFLSNSCRRINTLL